MKTITHEELLNEIVGCEGSSERVKYDNEVRVQVELYNMGEAIKTARIKRGLSHHRPHKNKKSPAISQRE